MSVSKNALKKQKRNNPVKIVLNMIVRNEEKNLPICFKSVRHLIDAIIISDTGSDDNTISYIQKYIENEKLLGRIVSHPWSDNFGINRTLALQEAEKFVQEQIAQGDKSTWYWMFMDADNEAKGNDDNFYKLDKSSLVKDTYYAQLDSGGIKYHYQWLTKIHTTEVDGVRVIDEKKRWSWECRRHEFVAPGTYDINRPLEDFTNSNTLKREWKKFSLKDTWTPEKEDLYGGYIISGRKGFRSTNRFTYIEDMASFMMDLKDDSENARLVFYLAQSLRDASYPKLAVKIYKKRAKMDNGYWEENYESLIWLGKYYFEKSTSLRNQVKGSLNEITKSKEKYSSLTDETRKSLEKELSAVGNNIPYSDAKLDKAMKYLTTALSYSPKRWEAPCYILKIFDLRKQYQGGWIFGRSYMDSPAPSSGLFLNTNIINYDFHLQLSLIAFYAGEVKAFKELTHKILQNPDAPNHIKELCRKNLQFAK